MSSPENAWMHLLSGGQCSQERREELEIEMGAMNTGEPRKFCLVSSTGKGQGVGSGEDFEKRKRGLEAQL